MLLPARGFTPKDICCAKQKNKFKDMLYLPSKASIRSGFTLIELLVVFSIVIILSTGSIVAYSSYNSSQKLSISARQLATVLQKAKSQAQNQIVPTLPTPSVCDKLMAYEVRICDSTSVSPGCNKKKKTYELDVICTNGDYQVESYMLPTEVQLNGLTTNVGNIRFQLLTGGVSGGGNVVFSLTSEQQKTVSINAQGIIQVN